MTEPILAWRNVWRNPRRTLLTALAVGFSGAVIIFFVSLQLSSYEASINATTRLFQGHIQIQSKKYFEKPQIRQVIQQPDQILHLIKEENALSAATERAFGFALISSDERTYGVQVVGVQPLSEMQVSSIPGRVVKGEYFTKEDSQEMILGEMLAKNLKVTLGDEVTLLGQGKDGSLAATVLKVKGIFASGSKELDRLMIHIPIKTFQNEFAMEGAVHTLTLQLEKISEVNKVEQSLEKALLDRHIDELGVYRWDELIPGLKQAIELDLIAGWVFFLLLIIIVSSSTLNTFLMSVLERGREFGVMLSLGATPFRIARMLWIECLIITLLGIFLGMVLGAAIVTYFFHHGFSVPGTEELLAVWNLPSAIYPRLTLKSMLLGPTVLTSVAMLSSLYPMYRVFTLEPVAAVAGR